MSPHTDSIDAPSATTATDGAGAAHPRGWENATAVIQGLLLPVLGLTVGSIVGLVIGIATGLIAFVC